MCAEARTTEREVDEMLAELDLDKDGKVSMDDFVRLLVSDHHRSDNAFQGSEEDEEDDRNSRKRRWRSRWKKRLHCVVL